MKTIMHGNLKVAVRSLRANKWRSFLTMLGIIIGVSSVISVISIGQGIKRQVSAEINHVGTDLITVRPGQVDTSPGANLDIFSPVHSGGTLSAKDVQALQHTSGVGAVVPLGTVGGTVKAENGIYSGGPVIASSEGLAGMLNQGIAYGAFFTPDDSGDDVAVLGSKAALNMFHETVPLGRTFSFRGQEFIVRGIFNDFPAAPLANDVDFNDAIFIPYTTAQQLTNADTNFYEILTKPVDSNQLNATVAAVNASLVRLHGDAHDFTVLKQSANLAATTSVLNLMTELIAGAAAISLLVGGIGIMNIMLVSVAERMHEIGIRKAVGATSRQILSEFMSEAIVISVGGVVIGIIVSLIIDLVLRILTSLTPAIQWQSIVLAGSVSILIGILFGSAPAFKAARKDPISALRGE